MSRRALEFAARGIGQVSPSPLVGCIIVAQNGETVGEGFYVYENLIHAEAIALEQAGERARGGTAYVSLEPHAHHGRTPPCTEALINAGIRRVVCPIEDPNPLVSGKGFARLINAGVEVVTGILADEATELNEKFVCWHQKGRPFVHFKTAVSLDGRIATRTGDSKWISNQASRRRAHELRHECDAILIGTNTALRDDPVLTDRSEKSRRRPLVRVVLDDRLRLPLDSRLVETAIEFPTIVFTNSADLKKIENLQTRKVEVVRTTSGSRDLRDVLAELRRRDVQSVLLEGGAAVAGAFFDAGLIDRATFFIAPLIIGGTESPTAIGGRGIEKLSDAFRLEKIKAEKHGEDLEITGLISN